MRWPFLSLACDYASNESNKTIYLVNENELLGIIIYLKIYLLKKEEEEEKY